jgi:hypothetical protein
MKRALFFIVVAAFLFLLSSCALDSGGCYYFRNNSSYEVSVEWWYDTQLFPTSGEFTLAPGAGKRAGEEPIIKVKGMTFDFNWGPASLFNLVMYEWVGTDITFMNK